MLMKTCNSCGVSFSVFLRKVSIIFGVYSRTSLQFQYFLLSFHEIPSQIILPCYCMIFNQSVYFWYPPYLHQISATNHQLNLQLTNGPVFVLLPLGHFPAETMSELHVALLQLLHGPEQTPLSSVSHFCTIATHKGRPQHAPCSRSQMVSLQS